MPQHGVCRVLCMRGSSSTNSTFRHRRGFMWLALNLFTSALVKLYRNPAFRNNSTQYGCACRGKGGRAGPNWTKLHDLQNCPVDAVFQSGHRNSLQPKDCDSFIVRIQVRVTSQLRHGSRRSQSRAIQKSKKVFARDKILDDLFLFPEAQNDLCKPTQKLAAAPDAP